MRDRPKLSVKVSETFDGVIVPAALRIVKRVSSSVCLRGGVKTSDPGSSVGVMKQVVTVKLLPNPAERAAMLATMKRCNDLANWVSAIAFRHRDPRTGRTDRLATLHKRVYRDLKCAGLGAQAAVRAIGKVVDAYATLHGQIESGALRGRRKAEALRKPLKFRPDAAQAYDDRCLSWDFEARSVSIWTTEGRRKNIRFACSRKSLELLARQRKGESDLIERDGALYLAATVEMPTREQFQPIDFLGVDRGVVNLATTSDGRNFQGRGLERYRRRQARARAELQRKATSRKLKQQFRKQRRHASHVNHKIAKEIVSVAERTGRGIALEDLGGIRERVRLDRSQRDRISNWPFSRVGRYIAYKAQLVGVPVLEVDARYTSQRCPLCHHTERANRRSRDAFECRACGLAGPPSS
jgi:IS605 OrfB family transposase